MRKNIYVVCILLLSTLSFVCSSQTSFDFFQAYPVGYLEHVQDCECKCAICFDTLNSKCYKLPCGHVFHYECIYEWVSCHATCPIDRSEQEMPKLHSFKQLLSLGYYVKIDASGSLLVVSPTQKSVPLANIIFDAPITTVHNNNSDGTCVSLANRDLRTLPDLSQLPIVDLDLSGNPRLGYVNPQKLPPTLQKLTMRNCGLLDVPDISIFPGIVELSVARNSQVTKLQEDSLPPNLERLDASWCERVTTVTVPPKIQKVNVVGCHNIESISAMQQQARAGVTFNTAYCDRA